MSTAASRGGAAAGPELGAALPVAAGTLVWAVALAQAIDRLDELQYVMYADHRHALLVVLQGMDAAGKDGTIRHVMAGFNPQGCRVTAFKRPSAEEADHDFLWRIHRAVPAKGDI